jgi:hypothetical protein
MPRISAEGRAGAYFRAGSIAPAPPAYLRAAGKELWRQIVCSRPVDRFDAGALPLLESYVVLVCHVRGLLRELARAKADTPLTTAELERRIAAMNRSIGTLASKLRLSVQARVDRRSGEIGEPGPGDAASDPLLGGQAVRRRAN